MDSSGVCERFDGSGLPERSVVERKFCLRECQGGTQSTRYVKDWRGCGVEVGCSLEGEMTSQGQPTHGMNQGRRDAATGRIDRRVKESVRAVEGLEGKRREAEKKRADGLVVK